MYRRLSKFAAAALIYGGFAIYLYQPYFKYFHKLQYLVVANACLASLGCFILSRRWLSSFCGSLFAGAVYGFGPFVLGLTKFHPTAGLLAATVPWLFCPAAFGPKNKWRWLRVPLCTLPFVAILLFFRTSAHYRLFAIPTQIKMDLANLTGLLAPLVASARNLTLAGFYHIPTAPLVMGFSMLLKARRYGVMIIFAAGTMLSFCNCFSDISPIMWLVIPVLCCSVLIGAGMQGLACAGFADRKWVLAVAVVLGVLSIVMLLLATRYFQVFLGVGSGYARVLVQTAYMYILGVIAVGIIFFMTRANARVAVLRWVILCSAMAVDIFLGARFIVDEIF